jgi:class 3 adenylate cyclase
MLPSPSHAEQLIKGELILDELKDVTLLYSDLKGFTPLSAKMHPGDLCDLLNMMYSSFDKHLDHFGLYKIDTIGDAFVVVGGLDGYEKSRNHPLACIQLALHMQNDMANIRTNLGVDVHLRIGIHTGTVMGSVVSLNKPRYLVWGPSTLTANAMESEGIPGGVMISHETKCRLDMSDLQRLHITLKEREYQPKIAMHTRAAYMVECSDLSGRL